MAITNTQIKKANYVAYESLRKYADSISRKNETTFALRQEWRDNLQKAFSNYYEETLDDIDYEIVWTRMIQNRKEDWKVMGLTTLGKMLKDYPAYRSKPFTSVAGKAPKESAEKKSKKKSDELLKQVEERNRQINFIMAKMNSGDIDVKTGTEQIQALTIVAA